MNLTRFESREDNGYKVDTADLQRLISKDTIQKEKRDETAQLNHPVNVQSGFLLEPAVQDVDIKLVLSILSVDGNISEPMDSSEASPMLSVSHFPDCKLEQYIDLDSESHRGIVWLHLPTNNTLWVHPCLVNIADHYNLHPNLPADWTRKERKSRKNLLHSRFMRPGCHIITPTRSGSSAESALERTYQSSEDASHSEDSADDAVNPNNASRTGASSSIACRQLQMYLPYLHWDTTENFAARSQYLESLGSSRENAVPERISVRTKAIMQSNRNTVVRNSYHARRSLDQYGYPGLHDTRDRDDDQVVSRNTKYSEGGRKMVMVDQLWLWVIEDDSESGGSSMVCTCFPGNDEEGPNDYADLRSSILNSARQKLNGQSSAIDLAALIVEQAISVMLEFQGEESLRFMEIFREAIAEAVSPLHQTLRVLRIKLM